jgi:tRNA-specific 2-thiouridylase
MNKENKQPRVIVGLSGGVDSSVSALLLKQQGYQVEGLFMRNWEETGDTHCTVDQDLLDAQTVCSKLGIRLHTENFSTDYWDRVFTHFLSEYKAGRTPNPDVLCNKEIKFKSFLYHALRLGADYIATGHYAGVQKKYDFYQLLKGVDKNKDQSYFLHLLNQEQLAKTLFPLDKMTKPRVREIAKATGFRNHHKKGSTGICFIGERRFREFLSRYLSKKPGNIETVEGEIVGQHDGLMYYTLGQREGMKIGGQRGKQQKPWYVVAKDIHRNVLVVAQGQNHPALFTNQLNASGLHWISGILPPTPFRCQAKIRYRQSDQACTINSITADNMAFVTFDTPQRAITPGQSIVFYQRDECLGGGIIEGKEMLRLRSNEALQ